MEDPALSGANNALTNKFFKFAYKNVLKHLKSEKLISYHCALIVKGGAILSVGFNKSKRNSHVKIHNYPHFCGTHSELDACIKAISKTNSIDGCTAYVLRVLKDGKTIEMSKPCEYCEQVLRSYGIKKVYYTTYNGGFASESLVG